MPRVFVFVMLGIAFLQKRKTPRPYSVAMR